MANKKISELQSRTPALSDLMLVGDPSSGYSYKCTVTALATIIETDIADGYVTIGTTQTISGAKTFSNNLTLTSVVNTPTDPDKFLTLNASNVVTYRTGAEVLSDIGGVGGSGTTNYLPKFSATTTLANSQIFDNGTNIGIATATPDATARVQINKTDGYGLYLNYNTSTGSGVTTTALYAINTTASSGYAAVIEEKTPNTTAGQYPFVIKHSLSSGTAGVGFGTGVHFQLLDDAGTSKTTQLTIENIDAAAATYKTRYRFNVQNNGSSTPVVYINGTGLGVFTASPSVALDVTGEGKFSTINNATTDTDKFLVSDSGVLKYRTGAEVLSDIGAASSSSISGTTNYLAKFTSSSAVGNSQIFDNGTNVGIGTNTPSRTLDVNGIITTNNNLELTSANPTILWTTSNLRFYNNTNGVVATISSAGQLSLSSIPNATTDTDKFLVSDGGVVKYRTGSEVLSDIGAASSSSISGTTNYIPKFTSSSAIGNSAITDDGTTVTLISRNLATPTISVAGSAAPTVASNERLTFSNSYDGTIQGRYYGAPATNQKYLNVGFDLSTYGSGASGFMINGRNGFYTSASGGSFMSTADYIAFGTLSANGFTNASPTFSEQMRLTSTGLGIGTSSPAYKLVVSGGNSNNNNDANTIVATGTEHVRLKIHTPTTGGYRASLILSSDEALSATSNEVSISTTGNDAMQFGTSGSTKMTLDASGNLGLGVTPSAWSGRKALQIDVSSLSASSGNMFLGSNYYDNGTNNLYINNGYSLLYAHQSGSHIWYNSPNGTAGNAISFTQAMTLDASGRLGIGTTTTTRRLNLQANNGQQASLIGLLDASGTIQSAIGLEITSTNSLQLASTAAIRFYSGSTIGNVVTEPTNERMRITSGGLVGIGTTSPSTALDVVGNGKFSGFVDASFYRMSGWAAVGQGGTIAQYGGILASQWTDVDIMTSGSTKMRITSGGSVGIGTTSPTNKLDVNGGITALGETISSGGTLYLNNTDNSQAAYLVSTGTGGSAPLIIATNSTERMRITSGGNVGIATTNPAVRLDVVGNIQASDNILIGNGSNAAYGLEVGYGRTTTGSSYVDLIGGDITYQDYGSRFTRESGGANANTGIYHRGTGLLKLSAQDAGAITFETTSSERMRITSGGDVAINTTTANSKLHVAGSLRLPLVTKSATYTLDATDYTVGFDCTGANRTANLPDATTCSGRIYVIYQFGGGSTYGVTIDGNSSQTINGSATYVLQGYCDYSSVMIQSDGSNWVVISDALQTGCL